MEALLYTQLDDKAVRCRLCNHYCVIKKGRRGICGVRENRDGGLVSLVYGQVVARNVDPVEKKPMYHLAPGTRSYSIATVGCNLKCSFCQNADIAQMPADRGGRIAGSPVSPAEIVADALRHGCRSIAYTYTEPTVYFELALDTARLARENGLLNIFVTNGYMTTEAIDAVAPVLDGANVDLKAYTDGFYRQYCKASLEPVKKSLARMRAAGIFVEVTTLLIPDRNDHPHELENLAAFISGELGRDTPWHISRYHPTYRMLDAPPTPVASLSRAREIGLAAGLRYVYMGNVPGEKGSDTLCHGCGRTLIRRRGFAIAENNLVEGACPDCGAAVAGLEMG